MCPMLSSDRTCFRSNSRGRGERSHGISPLKSPFAGKAFFNTCSVTNSGIA